MVSWDVAQSSVLGSVLLKPDLAATLARSVSAADFSGSHRTVFETITALLEEGLPIDATMVGSRLDSTYNQFLRNLMETTPTAANFDAYVPILKEQSRLAKARELAVQLADPVDLSEAREVVNQLNEVVADTEIKHIFSMSEMLEGFYDEHQGAPKKYIGWGLSKLDNKIFTDRGDVVIIGGLPSSGKSALMIQAACYMADNYRVGIFSFETSAAKLTDRMVAQTMGISFGSIKCSNLSIGDWQRISSCSNCFARKSLEVVEAAGMTVNDILGITLSRKYDVVFIDYVQLISTGSTHRSGTRCEEVAEISRALHVMAQRHSVLVVELSQLSRPDKTANGQISPPMLSSLRESGQLEQDADVVMLLYRIHPDSSDSIRNLFIAKNKEGELGQIMLSFNGSTQTFSQCSDPNK